MATSAMPMMRPRFAVTLPMALPMDISTMPMPLPGESASAARASSAAKMETSSSGKVVAKLTTVAPTISFGMPEASAIHDAASTKKSPPLMMSTRPTMSSKTVIAISICKFPFFYAFRAFSFSSSARLRGERHYFYYSGEPQENPVLFAFFVKFYGFIRRTQGCGRVLRAFRGVL